MYKLFYDTLPGNRVSGTALEQLDPKFRNGLWTRVGQIHNFMNTLGIDYTWTDDISDPDAVVILEIDSALKNVTETVLKFASENYKKSIVISPTEPVPSEIQIDVVSAKYPNVLYVCSGDYTVQHNLKNFALFPFMIIRSVALIANIPLHHLMNCNLLTSKKQFLFNHLSNFWAHNKYHTHYTIKNHFNFDSDRRALLSYKPIYISNAEQRLNQNAVALDIMKKWMKNICEIPVFSSLFPYEDYINKADPQHADHYRIESIAGDKQYDINNLFHPPHVYSNSHISLVTEVPSATLEYSTGISTEYNYISEKTVQPILHGHIFIVNAPNNYSTQYLQGTLGFELYNELFDYGKIEDTFIPNCLDSSLFYTSYKIIEQLNNFKPELIFDNSKQIAEKIQYNKSMLTNPNSKLRQRLKEEFTKILETYKDINCE